MSRNSARENDGEMTVISQKDFLHKHIKLASEDITNFNELCKFRILSQYL